MPLVQDGMLALLVAVLLVAPFYTLEDMERPGVGTLVLTVVASLAIVARRGFPMLVLLAVLGISLVLVLFDLPKTGDLVEYVAVYSVGAYTRGPKAAAGLVLGAVWAVAVFVVQGPGPPVWIVVFVAIIVAAWLLGAQRRWLRDDAARLRSLADELRHQQVANERQAVLEERTRIARDLHDAVAHHVSTIAVHAQVGERGVRQNPDLVAATLTHVRDSARQALTEMRRLLGLLRTDDERAAVTGRPSLRELEELARTARAAGNAVEIRLSGPLDGVPEGVGTTAYRILQEALTNVVKHATPTTVRVEVGCRDGEVRLSVVNEPARGGRGPVPGSGLGLVGMRERVALFGGTFDAGPRPDGGYVVSATIPVNV